VSSRSVFPAKRPRFLGVGIEFLDRELDEVVILSDFAGSCFVDKFDFLVDHLFKIGDVVNHRRLSSALLGRGGWRKQFRQR
jgi:hypothetical protein